MNESSISTIYTMISRRGYLIIAFSVSVATFFLGYRVSNGGGSNAGNKQDSVGVKSEYFPPEYDFVYASNMAYVDELYMRKFEGDKKKRITRWALIIYLTGGELSNKQASYSGDYCRYMQSTFGDAETLTNYILGELIDFERISYTKHKEGYLNIVVKDSSEKIVCLIPGWNSHAVKYFSSNKTLNKGQISADFSKHVFDYK